MPEVENDYVATATAEKRLRDVLTERFDNAVDTQYLMDTLLNAAEITYLPRKKSVSITLRIPETATASKPAKNGRTLTPEQVAAGEGGSAEYGAPPDSTPVDNNPGNDDSIPEDKPKRPARFGEFVPTVTSAPEYHEDDYFTE